jgi:glucoamylase
MVMRKGLVDGANFAARNGDSTRASTYTNAANSIKTVIDTFWSSSNNYVIVTQNKTAGVDKAGYDIASLIAANVGSTQDGFYTPGSEKVCTLSIHTDH